MNSKLKTSLQIVIPLVIAAFLIWYIQRSVDVPSIWEKVKKAELSWLIFAIFISLASHISRAYRWNLLMQPLGYNPALKNTFLAVMVAYFGNIFIPRGGEVFRCVALNRIERVSFNSSFGTVVAERAFDFFCLLLLIGLSLILEFDKFSLLLSETLFKKDPAVQSASLIDSPLFLLSASLMILFSIAAFVFRKRILTSPLFLKGKNFALGIWEGVISIKKLEKKGAFLFHTVFIWVCYYFMTYLVFFSLPATAGLGPMAGLVLLIIGALGMSAPASGGIGPFHIMVGGALQLFYGLSKEDGVAYAFVIHGSQFIMLLFVGLIATVIVVAKARKIKLDSPEPVKSSPEKPVIENA